MVVVRDAVRVDIISAFLVLEIVLRGGVGQDIFCILATSDHFVKVELPDDLVMHRIYFARLPHLIIFLGLIKKLFLVRVNWGLVTLRFIIFDALDSINRGKELLLT